MRSILFVLVVVGGCKSEPNRQPDAWCLETVGLGHLTLRTNVPKDWHPEGTTFAGKDLCDTLSWVGGYASGFSDALESTPDKSSGKERVAKALEDFGAATKRCSTRDPVATNEAARKLFEAALVAIREECKVLDLR